MDVLTFIKTLEQQGEQKDSVIFVITATDNVTDGLKEMRQQHRIHDFVLKPFISSEEFLKEIQEICAA